MIGMARAHTNIALIKYWGKRDDTLFLPMTNSLSLTLEAFYTDTKVAFDASLKTDTFFLNGKQDDATGVTRFLDLFRNHMNTPYFARVESYNFVPTAAGLASSASAYAALAGAINHASGLNLDRTTLSTFARRGSGSATRSLFGGFVEWDKGTTSENSAARQIDTANWDIGMVIIVVNRKAKSTSSRVGMAHTMATSPFYPAWVESTEVDLNLIKTAIAQQNLQSVGEIMEHNGMKMHATMLASNPPFCYFEPDSIVAQQQVYRLRQQGIPAYFTMDAGPNVKILCRASDIPHIMTELRHVFKQDQLIASLPGKGMSLLSDAQWHQSIHHFQEVSQHEC